MALSKLLKRAEKVSLSDLASVGRSKKATPSEVTELVANVLATALRAGASAIHIEPRSEDVRIRHRIDGVLTEAQLLPRAVAPVLVAGLKILAHLPVDEDETLPQQATSTVTVQGKSYKLHIATIPVEDGEKAVVQLTALGGKAPALTDLGYWGPALKAVSSAIAKPRGLVLLAGPHDSGQAESAYSLLSHLASPHISIATLEDPIMYRISGAAQTQVNGKIGLNFPTGLRALLKQDANALYISNVRDTETAHMTIEGALSGRLLIAGLYATNASSALSYLLAAGVEPYLVAHAVSAIVGQRVVRRLCESCKQIYSPSEQEMISILKGLGIHTAAQLQRVRELERQAIDEKVVTGASGTDNGSITSLYRPNKDGCPECSHTGYKGSVGIYEVLEITDTVQRLILGGATAQNIEDQAVAEGMPTMQMDGLVKVLLGLTSVDEVASATEA